MPIKTVLYVSRARKQRALRHLSTLIPLAREANKSRDITAVLRFDGAHYTQVIEGPTKAVDALMARIALDPRHSGVRVLFDERRPQRSYIGFPLTYLFDDTHRGLVTEVVDGKRVLSGIEIRNMLHGGPTGTGPSGVRHSESSAAL